MPELLFGDEGRGVLTQQPGNAGNIDLILVVGDDDQGASGGRKSGDVQVRAYAKQAQAEQQATVQGIGDAPTRRLAARVQSENLHDVEKAEAKSPGQPITGAQNPG